MPCVKGGLDRINKKEDVTSSSVFGDVGVRHGVNIKASNLEEVDSWKTKSPQPMTEIQSDTTDF